MLKISTDQATELIKLIDELNLEFEKEWLKIQKHRKQEIKKFMKVNYNRERMHIHTHHFKFALSWIDGYTVSDVLISCNIPKINKFLESIK